MMKCITSRLGLYLISISCLLLFACKGTRQTRQVFWTDLRDRPMADTVTMNFVGVEGDKRVNVSVKLKIHITKSVLLPEFCFCMGENHPLDMMLDYYPRYTKIITPDTDAIEIFIFDRNRVHETDTYFEVEQKDGIEAYYIEYCSKETNLNYLIVSKDNILEKKTIGDKPESLEKLMEAINTGDVAFYNSTDAISSPHSVPYNGYIVKNKVDGGYVWLSTYTLF